MASKTAYFYKVAKRKNSTLIPANGTAVEVDLKAGTDLISPSFLIQSEAEPDYNLMKYESRYYFIDRITSVRNNLWNIDCTEDFGATWKTNIRNTTAYVLYHNHENLELSDRRLGIESSCHIDSTTVQFEKFSHATVSNNAIIMTIISDDQTGVYAITQEAARTLFQNINSIYDAWGAAPSIVAESEEIPEWKFFNYMARLSVFMYQALVNLVASGNISDCIKTCFIIPVDYDDIVGEETLLKFGKYQSDITGKKITNRILTEFINIDIPWQTEDWRNNLPYTELYLYMPYLGLNQLSNSDLFGATSITVRMTMDLFSGDTIFILNNGSQTLGHYSTNVASPYSIGTSDVMSSEIVSTMINSVGGIAEVFTRGSVSGATSAINGACNILAGSPTCISGNSGGASLGIGHNVVMYSVFHDTVAEPETVSTTIGTPTNKVMSLSGINGYVQTSSASVSGTMLDAEREAVNNLLNGGVYIE